MMFGAMMKAAAARAESAAEGARKAVAVAAAEFPDLMVERDGDAIVISGRGLVRRWLGDARLRFALRGFR